MTYGGTEPPSNAGYKSAITPPSRDVVVYNPSGGCYNIYIHIYVCILYSIVVGIMQYMEPSFVSED